MKIIKTKIKDLLIIKKTFKDNRGYLKEHFKKKLYPKILYLKYYQNQKNVLRGLHIQKKSLKVNT